MAGAGVAGHTRRDRPRRAGRYVQPTSTTLTPTSLLKGGHAPLLYCHQRTAGSARCSCGAVQRRLGVDQATLMAALRRIVGPGGVSDAAHDQFAYEYDASFDTHLPTVVVWPTTTSQ